MRRAERGLTLLEVLVAILVLSFAVGATLRLIGQETANSVALRTNMLARIAAENVMVDVMLAARQGQILEEGSTQIGERTFLWAVERTRLLEGVDEVTVVIRDPETDQDRSLARLSTLEIGRRAP